MKQNNNLMYVRIVAIIITLGLLFVGFYYNKLHPLPSVAPAQQDQGTDMTAAQAPGITNDVVFACDNQMAIHAQFMDDNTVNLDLSDGRSLSLPQVISADGARYANADESFVFWNKGDGAFVTENGTQTYSNCVVFNGQ